MFLLHERSGFGEDRAMKWLVIIESSNGALAPFSFTTFNQARSFFEATQLATHTNRVYYSYGDSP
jgi:hypothetical protein